jgi:secreted trypsin-like serine protease
MKTRFIRFSTAVSLLLIAQLSVASEYLAKTRAAPDTQAAGTVKIVGGGAATQGEQRWISSIQYQNSHFCGGALVGDQWVLTAAHCMVGESASDPALSVWIGGNDLNKESQGYRRDVVQIVTHNQYNDSTLVNDIALLRLDSPVPGSVPTVLLPTLAVMNDAGAPNQPATVSGWGALSENGSSPDQLHEVTLPIVSNAVCNAPQSYGGEVNSKQICAGLASGGKDSCQGDSGGPLWLSSGGSEYHVGVVSWGEGCAAPDKYGVYTRTYSYRDWVLDRIGSNGGSDDSNDPLDPIDPIDPIDSGSCSADAAENALQSGETVSGLSGGKGAIHQFYIDVPAGQSWLEVRTWSGSGDVDLYVARDREASPNDHDYGPYLDGNEEEVRVRRPRAGRWHITVHGYASFSNVKLRAKIYP